ncbi:MAG TPA: hypothetical protein VL593_18455 [Ramlibacter sp.]|nr:hypothetical protein [Ramlibacter sp.]
MHFSQYLLTAVLLLALAGCAAAVPRDDPATACAKSETSYECQVERYHNVNAD